MSHPNHAAEKKHSSSIMLSLSPPVEPKKEPGLSTQVPLLLETNIILYNTEKDIVRITNQIRKISTLDSPLQPEL